MRSRALIAAALGAVALGAQTDPFQQNRRLGRGINLPGVFDRRGAPAPDPPLKSEYFTHMRTAGFRHVRLVIRWSSYADAEAPFRIQPDYLRKVDWAVEQCLQNKLAVVLDFHYYPLISFTGTEVSQEDPEKNRKRFLALWGQIAEHYAKSPPEVMFAVLNEPNRNLGVEGWNKLLAEALPLLRRTNPRRTVLIATANLGGFGALEGLQIPTGEKNAIVEVHYYNPGRFTHQQAPWSSNKIYKDVSWTATREETQAILDDFAKVAAWAKKHRRPLYLGEFGAYRAAEMTSRVRWTSFVARLAEKHRMSWAYWGFWRCGFDVFDEKAERWTEPLVKALAP